MKSLEDRYVSLRAVLEENGIYEPMGMESLMLVEKLTHRLVESEKANNELRSVNADLQHEVELRELQINPCMKEIKTLLRINNDLTLQIVQLHDQYESKIDKLSDDNAAIGLKYKQIGNITQFQQSKIDSLEEENFKLAEKIDSMLADNYISHLEVPMESGKVRYGKYPQRLEDNKPHLSTTMGSNNTDDTSILDPAVAYSSTIESYQTIISSLKQEVEYLKGSINQYGQLDNNHGLDIFNSPTSKGDKAVGNNNNNNNNQIIITSTVANKKRDEEIKRLSDELASAMSPDYIANKVKLQDLTDELEKCQLIIKTLKDPNMEAVRSCEVFIDGPALSQLTHSLSQSEKMTAQYRKKCNVLATHISSLCAALKQLGYDPSDAIKQAVYNFDRDEEYITQLEAKLEVAQSKLSQQSEFLPNAEDHIPNQDGNFKQTNIFYKKQYDKLNIEYTEFYNDITMKYDQLQAENKKLEDEVSKTLADRITYQERYKSERSLCLELKEHISGLNREKDEITKMCFELTNDKHMQLESLDSRMQLVHELTSKLTLAQSEITQLQKTQAQFDKTISNYKTQLQEANSFIDKLSAQRSELSVANISLTKELDGMKAMNAELNSEIDSKRSEMQNKLVEINALYKQTQESLALKNKHIEQTTTEAETKLLDYKIQINELKHENSKLIHSSKIMDSQLKSMEDSLKKLSRKIIDMEYSREITNNDKSMRSTNSSTSQNKSFSLSDEI